MAASESPRLCIFSLIIESESSMGSILSHRHSARKVHFAFHPFLLKFLIQAAKKRLAQRGVFVYILIRTAETPLVCSVGGIGRRVRLRI